MILDISICLTVHVFTLLSINNDFLILNSDLLSSSLSENLKTLK